MNTQGIRILDKTRVLEIKFFDISEEVLEGNLFYWSILSIDGRGNLGEDKSIPLFCNQVNELEKGLLISWNDLNILSKKFFEIFEILIIGCKDKDLIKRYKNDQKMYESCDIVIELIDSNFWQVFAKNKNLIEKLAKKFNNTEFLKPDFQNES